MSATYKKLNIGQQHFMDAKGLFITPYDSDGLLGETTYDINDIVGDTINVTPDDATKNETPHEFTDDPLLENTTLGKKNFTCDCIDFQDDIMKALYGCKVINGAVVFPAEYKDLFVMIRVAFDDKDVVMPYVKMDAKAIFENLRSGVARGQLSGTLMSKEVVIAGLPAAGEQAPSTAVTKVTTSGSENYETTPMVFVPSDSTNGKAVYVPGAGTTGTTSSSTVYMTDIHAEAASKIARLEVSPSSITATAAAYSENITSSKELDEVVAYDNNTGPSYDSVDWCTASAGSGIYSKRITVECDENETGSERTCYVKVTSVDNEVVWVTVTQAASDE